MFRVYYCVVLLSLIALSQEHKTELGACPQYTGLTSFDVNEFVGDWYVIQQSGPEDPCMMYSINKARRGRLRVSETAYESPDEVKFTREKMLKFKRGSTSQMILYTHAAFEPTSEFTVLMTDYTSFAAVFICQERRVIRSESIEIWSREPTLDADTIQQVREALIAKGMGLTGVDAVDQTTCREVSD